MPKKISRLLKCYCITTMLVFFSSGAIAQKAVTGKIINGNDKQSIAGATIQVSGTETYAQSVNDGSFSIQIPRANSVLLVPVVGFDRAEIPVSGRTDIGDISRIQRKTYMPSVRRALILPRKPFSGELPRLLPTIIISSAFLMFYLWAAECEVEVGSLDKAEDYVNKVRDRAADPSGWVYKSSTYNAAQGMYTTQAVPADKYLIKAYPAASFTGNGQDYARKAVRFERRLELAMEGNRFFDLQRWDNGTGYMADILNTYVNVEKTRLSFYYIVNTAVFTKGVNEYFAIPQVQIDAENATGVIYLKQNNGYN